MRELTLDLGSGPPIPLEWFSLGFDGHRWLSSCLVGRLVDGGRCGCRLSVGVIPAVLGTVAITAAVRRGSVAVREATRVAVAARAGLLESVARAGTAGATATAAAAATAGRPEGAAIAITIAIAEGVTRSTAGIAATAQVVRETTGTGRSDKQEEARQETHTSAHRPSAARAGARLAWFVH